MHVQFCSLMTAAALLGAVVGCTPPAAPPRAPAPTEQAATPSGPVHSRGVVVTVTREHNAVTIQHEPIPQYGMDAMTMEFTVANPSELNGIEAGDTVTFALSGPLDIATISEAGGN